MGHFICMGEISWKLSLYEEPGFTISKRLTSRIQKEFIVVTGVSGSGNSSLAFDLQFEEGRNRYLESAGLSMGTERDEYEELASNNTGGA
jgi:hypothetical protein